MATESERYLGKARESLASAEADVAVGRNNSAANRAYYSVFQAAVAALLTSGVVSAGNWEHRFVGNEFSGKLIWRRKVFPRRFADVLPVLFDRRIVADYKDYDVSSRKASNSVRQAAEFTEVVEQWIRTVGVAEPRAPYGSEMTTKVREPKKYVEELKSMIASARPDARIKVLERGARDFTIEVYGDDESIWDVQDVISERRSEIFCEHDVWIVVLPLDESWRNQ